MSNEPIQRYSALDIADKFYSIGENDTYVLHADHEKEVAKLTEEVERLRKVAEQATRGLTLSIISGREFFIRDDLGEKYVRGFADAKPELAQYLKDKEKNV